MFVSVLWGLAPGENAPQGVEWWGLFVFLIPFEAIGLGMVLAFVAALLEPVHRTRWTFTRWGIEQRHTWLGLGPRWTWTVEGLERIELRRDGPSGKRRFGSTTSGNGEGRGCRLSLVDRENAELCSIGGLTEGEARWMGDVLLKEREGWLR